MRSGGQDFSRHPDVLEVTDEATRRPTSKPLSVSPCAPRARPDPRSAVGHPAHGAGRRGRRPLPPILPRRGPAREGPAPPRRGTSERARRATSPGGRVAIHCDRGRRASCRSTRSARRQEGTEEVESWFTRTSVMDCLIPRLGKARSLSDAPRRGGANPSRAGLSSGGDFTLRTVSERGAGMVKKRE